MCQQASTQGDCGLSTVTKRTHYRLGYQLNRAEGVWNYGVNPEGQKTRCREA